MKSMEHSTAARQPVADRRRTQADSANTDGRDILHFESLRVPGLMSVPLFIAWLRKPFRRKDRSSTR